MQKAKKITQFALGVACIIFMLYISCMTFSECLEYQDSKGRSGAVGFFMFLGD